jgi:hypothetical protein
MCEKQEGPHVALEMGGVHRLITGVWPKIFYMASLPSFHLLFSTRTYCSPVMLLSLRGSSEGPVFCPLLHLTIMFLLLTHLTVEEIEV